MNRATGLKARKPLAPISAKKRAELAGVGITNPMSTFTSPLPADLIRRPRLATPPKVKRREYTGPKRSVCVIVDQRSGLFCEWPGCWTPQVDRHHRLNRKAGGRHGEMRERLNSPAWLLGACRHHHDLVTSPPKGMVETYERMGWILREGQDATQVEVFTRHQVDPIVLTNDGGWVDYAARVAS